MQGIEAAQAACSSLVWMSQWMHSVRNKVQISHFEFQGRQQPHTRDFESNLNWKQRKMRQVQRAIIGMDTAE